MTLFYVAIGLAIAAIVLFVISRSLAAKVLDVAGTETVTAASLAELCSSVAKEIGAGSFAQKTELKGRAIAREPLRADFSGTEAVWYECVVQREWEEDYWETDKDGNRQHRTRRGSDTVSSIRREPPFELEDATGRALVDPRGAQVEPETTFSSYEPGAGRRLSVGSFVLDALASGMGGRRTLGHRFTERSIPVGRELYVLGEASDSGGTLSVRKPAKGRFIVSTRSEEAIVAGARTGVRWTGIFAWVSAAGAAGTLAAKLLGLG